MKKVWIATAVIGIGILATVITVLIQSQPAPKAPAANPSPSVTTTAGSGKLVESDGEDLNSFKAKQDEVARNPLLSNLPHYTPYWSIEFDGVENNKYSILATVFYRPGENPSEAIEIQKPFILNYIRDTGQPEGTFSVRYETRRVERD